MKKKKATVRTPVTKLTGDEKLDHYRSILMEEFHTKLDLMIEGFESFKGEIRSEIVTLRHDMESQFSLVHAAIRCNADSIRELRRDVNEIKIDVGQLKRDMYEARNELAETSPCP